MSVGSHEEIRNEGAILVTGVDHILDSVGAIGQDLAPVPRAPEDNGCAALDRSVFVYSDLNFLIPELVTGVQFRKGPYYAQEGDFSAAGSAHVNYANVLAQPIASASLGQDGWGRLLLAASPKVGEGTLLGAIELNGNDGPWDLPDDYRRINGVVRYSRGKVQNAFSLTGLFYGARWHATDQVPDRAIERGLISRFGAIDGTDGGRTARYSVVADYQRTSHSALTRVTAFASRYRLNLFSNFTFALDDPEHGDQFEQVDRRWVAGGRVAQTRKMRWGDRLGENTFGVQVRNDDIPVVGLYRTEARTRRSTTRQDAVTQTSVGVFAENELRWLPWLRTTAGIRVDGYRFDVRADDPANSGTTRSGLVSPKGGAVFGPWRNTELYVNAGTGYHSNDARGSTISRDPLTGEPAEPGTPLVRAKGAEVGFRTVAIPRMQSTVALWRLDFDSELLFLGDAGTTEAGRPSRRYGIEWTNYARLSSKVNADADLAWSRARFTNTRSGGGVHPWRRRTGRLARTDARTATRILRQRPDALLRRAAAHGRRHRQVGAYQPRQRAARLSRDAAHRSRRRRFQSVRHQGQRHRLFLYVEAAGRARCRSRRHSHASGAPAHGPARAQNPVLRTKTEKKLAVAVGLR